MEATQGQRVRITYYPDFSLKQPEVTTELTLSHNQLDGICLAFYVHDWTGEHGDSMIFEYMDIGEFFAPSDLIGEAQIITAEIGDLVAPTVYRGEVAAKFNKDPYASEPRHNYSGVFHSDRPGFYHTVYAQFDDLINFMQGYASACSWLGIDYRRTYHSLTDGKNFYAYN